MYISRIIFLSTVFSLLLPGLALAQGTSTTSAKGGASQTKVCPPYSKEGMTYNANPIVNAIDGNMDGILTHDEWMIAGAPENSFQGFIKKSGKDHVTKQEFLAETPPNGIDTNCDGYITIWEFRATNKGCPPYNKEGMTYNANPIVNAIDTNQDGIMTHEEWTAAGAPEGSFQGFIKKSDKDHVTKQEFLAETPPNGIDKNCDGYITIWEFRNTAISK